MKRIYWVIGFVIVIVSILGLTYIFFDGYFGNRTMIINELCEQSGGTVVTQLCCKSATDFPDTCLIGACGCSPTDSHEIKVCDCGVGKCWNSNENKCVSE